MTSVHLKSTGMSGCTSVCLYVFLSALDLEHVVTLWFDIMCRSLSSVLGFSKITNIAGREWQRRDSIMNGRKPEHPRASSTDDVECFFSIMRDSIGRNFTTKEVKLGFRKICAEFTKCLDPTSHFSTTPLAKT